MKNKCWGRGEGIKEKGAENEKKAERGKRQYKQYVFLHGLGHGRAPKTYVFIGIGPPPGPKPYLFIGFLDAAIWNRSIVELLQLIPAGSAQSDDLLETHCRRSCWAPPRTSGGAQFVGQGLKALTALGTRVPGKPGTREPSSRV